MRGIRICVPILLLVAVICWTGSCGNSSSPGSPKNSKPTSTPTSSPTFTPSHTPGSPTPTPTITPTCIGVFGDAVTTVLTNLGTVYTFASSFVLTENAAVTAISVYSMSNMYLKVGIYSDTSSAPNTLVVVSNPVTLAANGWVTVGVGPVNLSAGNYWLAVGFPSSSPTGGEAYTNQSSGSMLGCSGFFSNPWATAFTDPSDHLSMEALYQCR